MDYKAAIHHLRRAVRAPLPARQALDLMSPRTPEGHPFHGVRGTPPGARPAAGLVLLYPGPGREVMFVLTERSPHLPAHPGQIGLPAGMQMEHETLEHAACRETEEEIGIDVTPLELLGPLSSVYIPPTNILLHPFLGHLDHAPALRALPREVIRIFEVPLEALLDPTLYRSEPRRLQGGDAVVPYFALAGVKIWGATGIVLAELRCLLENFEPDQAARNRAT